YTSLLYTLSLHDALPIFLDAHLKSALTAIRSLGAKGVRICAGSERTTAMGLHSQYIAKSFVYPSPTKDRTGFLNAISEQAKQLRSEEHTSELQSRGHLVC